MKAQIILRTDRIESVVEKRKHAPLYLAIMHHIVWSTEHWNEVLVHGVDEYLKIEMGGVRKRCQ